MLPEVEERSRKPISGQARADLELAYAHIYRMPKYSVVLAKNGRVVAEAVGTIDELTACRYAAKLLELFYRRRGWIRPWQTVVAVVNFPLLWGDVDLMAAGVDVVLMLERPPAVVYDDEGRPYPGKEQEIVDRWLAPRREVGGKLRYNLLRAMLFLRYDLNAAKLTKYAEH